MPPNSARAMRNLREVAEFFEAHGHAAIARRLLSSSEGCSGNSTLDPAVVDLLRGGSRRDVARSFLDAG